MPSIVYGLATVAVRLIILLISLAVYQTFFSPEAQRLAVQPEPIFQGSIAAEAASNATRDRALQLAESIRFRTVSSAQGAANTAADEFIKMHKWLQAQFPLVHSQLEWETVGEYSLLFHWKSGKDGNAILLCAHMDVVPASIDDGWSVDPFRGIIKDQFIWGRGTLDFKNGVVGILRAVEELLRSGHSKPGRDIYLAFGHDEEVGGVEGAKKIGQLLGSRGIRFQFVLDEGTPVSKGLLPLVSNDLHVAMLGVAEKGYYTMNLTMKSSGGHSSMPPADGTIITRMAQSLALLQAEPIAERLSQSPTYLTYRHLSTHLTPMVRLLLSAIPVVDAVFPRWLIRSLVSNSALLLPFVETVQSVTIINGGIKENVLPGHVSATVNFRILPGTSISQIKEHIVNVLRSHSIWDEKIMAIHDSEQRIEPSYLSSVNSASYKYVGQVVRGWAANYLTEMELDRVAVVPSLMIGATDTKHYQHLTDCILRFSPLVFQKGDPERLHAIDERVSVEAYSAYVEFFKQLIMNLE